MIWLDFELDGGDWYCTSDNADGKYLDMEICDEAVSDLFALDRSVGLVRIVASKKCSDESYCCRIVGPPDVNGEMGLEILYESDWHYMYDLEEKELPPTSWWPSFYIGMQE